MNDASEVARQEPVASAAHTLGLLGIMAAWLGVGFALQALGAGSSGGGPAPDPSSARPSLVPSFLESLAFDWGLVLFVWVGVRERGGLLPLSGARWSRASHVFRDIAVAVPFWLVWELTAHSAARLLWSGHAQGDTAGAAWIGPEGIIEVTLWLVLSASAGFCEELVFRGYLQRQLSAWTARTWIGVLGQAIAFGMIHPLRGWRFIVLVGVLGLLYGALAAWRRDLKPGMIAHALSDVWEGWLKHLA